MPKQKAEARLEFGSGMAITWRVGKGGFCHLTYQADELVCGSCKVCLGIHLCARQTKVMILRVHTRAFICVQLNVQRKEPRRHTSTIAAD